jgi:Glycoside-hydrolase family GH114
LSLGPLALILTAMAGSLGSDGTHAAAGPDRWQPQPGERWQCQLESSDRGRAATGAINVGICERPAPGGPCVRPRVFDIDLYQDGRISGNDHTVNVAAGRAIHRRGRAARLRPARRLEARTAKCADAGFDGIGYDIVDAYAQGRRVTGWRIDARTQLRFNRALARIAHSHGLAVGLKNDLGQVPALEPHFGLWSQ